MEDIQQRNVVKVENLGLCVCVCVFEIEREGDPECTRYFQANIPLKICTLEGIFEEIYH